MNKYVQNVLESLERKNAHEAEFLQAAEEILSSLDKVISMHPEYEQQSLLERFVEPERVIQFRVPWVDDSGKLRVNRAFRVQFNGAIGPYKGGMRFHPSVNLSTLKFLAMEQTLKNALTGIAMGGGKGGADFDPHGKSEGEVMRFCQSLMTELYRHIGANIDVPAGDIGVGAREIGFMFGQYKRIVGEYSGVLTGKGLSYGGCLGRKEATGYGLCYFTEAMLNHAGDSLKGKRVVLSGSGNVALYAAQKAKELGATPVAMSDSQGFVVDENGIDIELMKDIKENRRERISAYAHEKGLSYHEGSQGIWEVPCDVALPCATQNELPLNGAKALVKNGVKAVAEGANMPSTKDAVHYLKQNNVLFAPAKAANAGGVSVSGLEMGQNAQFVAFTQKEVDAKLHAIMENIFATVSKAASLYGSSPTDYAAGANAAGFLKVADAMLAQGCV
ncbi:MAG: NADP-specific glutamate dehydrogenase [Eubacteriales bacterium]|nr:NADP-specific glutamate dehydrogenase [Eubacteriales bacterium]